GAVADHADVDDRLTARETGDAEATRRIGDRALTGLVLDRELRTRDRTCTALRDDGAGDDALLCMRAARKGNECRRQGDRAGAHARRAPRDTETGTRATGDYG